MKKLLQGRSLLYASVTIVCVYTALIALFTKDDAIDVFNNTYLIIPIHILVLYGIVRLADYCLQKQKVIIRSTVRILFTILLVLAQFPFVIRYIANIIPNHEEVLIAMNTLRHYELYIFNIEQILLYQLPWVVMLCVLLIKYIQPTRNNRQTQKYEPATDVYVATSNNSAKIENVQNNEFLTAANNEDIARNIKLKTQRRLQTFGIFIGACAVFFVALFVGIAGAYSNRSHDPLESIGILLLFTSYGLFAWVGIRILLGIIRFFKSAILSSPTSTNSFTTNRPQSNSATNVHPEENLIVERSEETKIAFNEETTNYADLLERGVSKEEIIANSAGKIVQTSTVEYFSFSSNQQDTSMKLQFIVVSVLAMVIRYILSLIIPFGAFQFAYFVDIFSVGINGFCFIYGLYYLITSRVNKGLSIIILFLPFVHFLILKIL